MKPRLTIIVPVYNRASEVVATLETIAASTHRPLWMIVVDNGSTDDSKAVCEEWANRWRSTSLRVDVVEEPYGGAPAARNMGLRLCETRYVYFFDSDDRFSPDFLEDVETTLLDVDCDLLFTPVRQGAGDSFKVRHYEPTGRASLQIIMSMLSTHSMVFRTVWLREIGGWDERLSIWQDWELGVRALLHQPSVHWQTEKAYHEILLHRNSITGASAAERWEGTLEAMRVVKDEVQATESLSPHEYANCWRALYLRAMIHAGLLSREGCEEGAQAYTAFAMEMIPHPTKPLRMWGMVLRNYVASGGRGAWRVARQLL